MRNIATHINSEIHFTIYNSSHIDLLSTLTSVPGKHPELQLTPFRFIIELDLVISLTTSTIQVRLKQ